MRIGGSLFLIALGAILRFAVATQHSHGFNIGTIGVILMIVGAVGLIITVAWMSTRRRTDVIDHTDGAARGNYVATNDPAYTGTRRRTYIEPNDPVDGPY